MGGYIEKKEDKSMIKRPVRGGQGRKSFDRWDPRCFRSP